MDVTELAPGLWRWTERHPEWTPEQSGRGEWGPDVSSVYCEAFGDVFLIDPVLPAEGDERDRFWRALDRDVERAARPLHVLLTSDRHARSSGEIAARYPGTLVRVPKPGDALPGRVTAIEAALEREVFLWLPLHAALVAGDTLTGDGMGGIRLCPDSWLGDRDPAAVRVALRARLGELPVERVLVAHGAHVPARGREALARALN